MIKPPHKDLRIWAIAFAETIVWASLYYIFPALLGFWEQDFGWSKTEITVSATLALLVSAIVAPNIGRFIDHGHGRLVLTSAACLGGFLLMGLSFVDGHIGFFALWIAIGIMMGGCLYEPCFALLTHQRGHNAKAAITLITLVAGFAGTISIPVATEIASVWGWRTATLVFGAAVVLVATPLFWFGTGGSVLPDDPSTKPTEPAAERERSSEAPLKPLQTPHSPLQTALRQPTFWLLGFAFAMIALNHGMVVNHLLPLLDERGIDLDKAVLAFALIGPMQVVGRIIMMLVERHIGMIWVGAATFLFVGLAATVLGFAAALPVLIYVFVVLQGSGYGVTSITRPVISALLLGRTGFGIISGALAIPFVTATALAPLAGSLIWEFGGYDLLVWTLGCLMIVGLISFGLAVKLRPTQPAK